MQIENWLIFALSLTVSEILWPFYIFWVIGHFLSHVKKNENENINLFYFLHLVTLQRTNICDLAVSEIMANFSLENIWSTSRSFSRNDLNLFLRKLKYQLLVGENSIRMLKILPFSTSQSDKNSHTSPENNDHRSSTYWYLKSWGAAKFSVGDVSFTSGLRRYTRWGQNQRIWGYSKTSFFMKIYIYYTLY